MSVDPPVAPQPPLAGARVLVVEDDVTVADVVRRYLERAGATVQQAADGMGALALVQGNPPDLVVLDLMLPGMHGRDVCRRIRATSQVPIIMLTALDQPEDRIGGLDLGADDYIAKPFSPRELIARANAVLRRAGPVADPGYDEQLTIGGIRIEPASRKVWRDDVPLNLTVREFELLLFLMRHAGRVFRREELLEAVWGYRFGDTSTVTVHVRRLREKVEPDPTTPIYVQTVWGVGYRFDGPSSDAS